jgi:hypothetical protein
MAASGSGAGAVASGMSVSLASPNTPPYIDVTPDSFNISNYNTPQQNAYLHGKQYVSVRIANTTKRNNVIRQFKDRTPIYDNRTFSAAPDGVYIYLLSDKGFSAIQVRSYIELGAKHKILAKETGASKVFIAGELSKNGAAVVFNLLSGTYTRYLVEENTTGNLSKKMQHTIESILLTMGLTPTFTTETLINKKKLPLSDDELRLYKNMGYEIRSYPKEGFCSKYEIGTLQAQLSMKQNTLSQLRKRFPEDPHKKLESEIAEILATLAKAEECARKSTMLGGRAFTRYTGKGKGKRKGKRKGNRTRKHRCRS